MADKDLEIVHPQAPGFIDKITPKQPTEALFFFKCTKKLPKPATVDVPQDPDYPENIEVTANDPYRTAPPPEPMCGNTHYRHAGYMTVFLPFMKPGGQKEVIAENRSVMVCTKCRNCYIWDGTQMFDVTSQIDLKAWEKLEKEVIQATGPGGDC